MTRQKDHNRDYDDNLASGSAIPGTAAAPGAATPGVDAPGTTTPADPAPASIDDVKRYLSDLETIRGLMTRYEEQPLVNHWVFAVWGLLVILGSVINWRFAGAFAVAQLDPLVVVWIPVLLVGSIVETLGGVLKSRDTGIPLLTRRRTRLFIATIGILVILGIIIAHLDRVGFTTTILIALGATPLFIYALATYSDLFTEGFVLLAAAIVIALVGDTVNTLAFRGVGGITVGVVYIIAGAHSAWCERRAGHRDGAAAPQISPDGRRIAASRTSARDGA
ncbi:MAG: hypothetical protein PF508_07880 [Spirochaeta sp.]|jgi:hypothetical protein|nr:hypothetical protein [Spirochaeta sp.]